MREFIIALVVSGPAAWLPRRHCASDEHVFGNEDVRVGHEVDGFRENLTTAVSLP